MTARVLYVMHRPQVGGAEVVILNTLAHVDRSRFSPVALAPQDGPITERLAALGIPYATHAMPEMPGGLGEVLVCGARYLGFSRWLTGYLRREGFNLVHANTVFGQLWAGRAARTARVASVWHVHEILRPGRRNGFLLRYGARQTERVVAVSEAVRRSLLRFGIPDERIAVIRNGLDPDGPFRPDVRAGSLRQDLGIPAGSPIVLMPGVISRWKGQHVFVEAAARVAQRAPGVRFVVVGEAFAPSDGPYAAELRALACRRGVEQHLCFAGRRSDMPAVAADAAIVVHASVWEDPLPNVVLEAMAMGKAIIASGVGGVREMIEDGSSGVVLPPGDATALAEAIMVLLNDPQRRARLGAAAYRRFREHFTMDRYLSELQSLYDEVLSEGRAGKQRACPTGRAQERPARQA